MKLLFDQNLSSKLCQALVDLFPGSSQVRLLGLAEADDHALWQHAKANAFILVSQVSDFADMAALYGPPPKVIWLHRQLPGNPLNPRVRLQATKLSPQGP